MTMTPVLTGSVLKRYERTTSQEAKASRDARASQNHTPITQIIDPRLRVAIEIFREALAEALVEPMASIGNAIEAYRGNLPLSHWSELAISDSTGGLTQHLVDVFPIPLLDWIRGDAIAHLPGYILANSSHKEVEGSDDAALTVRLISRRLGLPIRDIVEAAGISRSSFYSWSSPNAPRPRVSSQGHLWELAQMVDDLDELLGESLQRWILADPQRRVSLAHGDFAKLLDEAAQPKRRPRKESDLHSAIYAVGGDTSVEEDEPLRKSMGKVTVATSVPAQKRRDS
jgi:hypothetical protein